MVFDLLTNLSVVIGLGLITIVFMYQTSKKHRKVFFLSFGLIIPIVAQSFYVLINTTSFIQINTHIGKYIRDYLFGIFYFLIFIHFHNLFKENDTNYIVNFIFGIISIFTSFLFLSIVTEEPVLISITGRFANVIGLACFSYISYVCFLVAKMLREREAIVEFTSFFIIFVAHIIYVLGDNFFLNFFDYTTLADVMGIIGIFLLLINYLSNLDYLYRLPFPIHQIIIYNNSGLCVYSRTVRTKGIKAITIEEMLFSGLISAISNGIKESLGTTTELRYIDATNKHILLEMYKGLTIVVVSDNRSKLLVESIKTVNKLIPDDIRNELNGSLINVSKIPNLFDSYIKIAFPYIIITNQSS